MLGLSPPTDQQWLTQRLRGRGDRPALVWSDVQWSYDQLVAAIETWRDRLTRAGIVPGDVVAICGDYSPNACSLLLACALNGNIIVPLTRSSAPAWARMINIAEVGYAVEFDADDDWRLASSGQSVTHRLLHALIERRPPG